MPRVTMGYYRAQAVKHGKPHAVRFIDGNWYAITPSGHIGWGTTPSEAVRRAIDSDRGTHRRFLPQVDNTLYARPSGYCGPSPFH